MNPTKAAESVECTCAPDDPCFCPFVLTPLRTIRPSAEFVQQARALGDRRYPLRLTLPAGEV